MRDARLKRLQFFRRVELEGLPEAGADRSALHRAVLVVACSGTKVFGRQVIVVHGIAVVELEHSHRLNELAHRARERQIRIHVENPRFLEHQMRLARGNAVGNIEDHVPYLRRQVHHCAVGPLDAKLSAGYPDQVGVVALLFADGVVEHTTEASVELHGHLVNRFFLCLGLLCLV